MYRKADIIESGINLIKLIVIIIIVLRGLFMEYAVIFTETNIDILFKLCLSMILGIMVGLDRQLTNKLAGIKTQVLVCMGSTIFTMLSINGFSGFGSSSQVLIGDPARVAAQILTGIGFIGGGVILKTKSNVFGVTTAASLWIVASIGMAVGTGDYFMAITGTILTVIVLVVIRRVERNYLDRLTEKKVRIHIEIKTSADNFIKIVNFVQKKYKSFSEMSYSNIIDKQNYTKLHFQVYVGSNVSIQDIYNDISNLEKLDSLKIYRAPSPYD
jgi:putative Mg2+ transporter-C (MgtC) family protein